MTAFDLEDLADAQRKVFEEAAKRRKARKTAAELEELAVKDQAFAERQSRAQQRDYEPDTRQRSAHSAWQEPTWEGRVRIDNSRGLTGYELELRLSETL